MSNAPSAHRIAAALCLAALVATVSCGRTTGGQSSFVDSKPLPAEPLKITVEPIGTHGGRFVFGETVGPKTFNELMANETSSTDITDGRLFTALVGFDNATQEITPMLAKSWALAPDGLTWTFRLRQGAAFSDGHPMTSADVAFSFEVAYDPTLHPSVQDLLKTDGKNWEVSTPDPLTVAIKTPSPNAMLVQLAGSVYIMPKHVLEPAFRSGNFASAYNVGTPPDQLVTSGPWRLQQYVAGEKTVLARNPYWFAVDQQGRRLPYLNELIYLIVPDQDAADLKFRAGELDGLDNVKPENYRWYEDHRSEGAYSLETLGPALNTNFFWFNLNRVRKAVSGKKLGEPYVDAVKYGWFNNPVFRRAVSMAVDRDAMITSIFYGNAVKNWSQSTPGNKLWYTPDVVRYDYDPEQAKRLLAGLGWRDSNRDGVLEDGAGHPVTFSLKTNGDNLLRVSMANFIRDDLAKVGIRVTLTPVDFNTLITNLRSDFQYDAILLGLQSAVPPDPAMGQNVWRSSGLTHNWNIAQPSPETPEEARIDRLLDVLIAKPDMSERKAAWVEIQNIVNTQSWIEWLPTLVVKVPIRSRFANVKPSVIPHRILWNIEQVYVKPPSETR